MPQYLDNIWSDQGTMRGMGDSFNNAIVGLASLRARQQQLQQQQQLDRAYFQLSQQKQLSDQAMRSKEFGLDERAKGAQIELDKAHQTNYELQSGQMRGQDRSGELAASALRALMTVRNPTAQAQQVPIPQVLSQALGPQQGYDQQSMINALQGILSGEGGRMAMQAPSQVGKNLAELQYSQMPGGLQAVAAGYQAPQRPISVPPGGTLVGPEGNTIFSAPPRATDPNQVEQERLRTMSQLYEGLLREARQNTPLGQQIQSALTKGMNLGPQAAPQQGKVEGGPVVISNDQEYDQLPVGTVYVSPDGKTRVKK